MTLAVSLSILQVAEVCHEANRAYCHTTGDDSQPAWADAPEWQRESAIHGVEGILSGRIRTPEDAHLEWCREKWAAGWRYGPTKNPERKLHPCLVDYDQLPPEQRAKDALFFAIAGALLLFQRPAPPRVYSDAEMQKAAADAVLSPTVLASMLKQALAERDERPLREFAASGDHIGPEV